MAELDTQARWLRDSVGVRALALGCVRVGGEDARTWLNGQITNDVSRTRAGDAVYAVIVDVRGRILTDLFALDRGDGFALLLPRDRLDPMLAHLERYVVMEDVELAGRAVEVVTAQGPASAGLELGGFPCPRLGGTGVDLLDVALDVAVARAERLGGGLVGEDAWELARLRAARPAYGPDFDESTYPQEAGLAASAVSFTKGCYVGQEVVCMLENRGQLRRRLVALEAEVLVPPGTPLLRDGAEVGAVRSGVRDPEDGRAKMLGYVKRSSATPGTLLATSATPVTVREVVGGAPALPAP